MILAPMNFILWSEFKPVIGPVAFDRISIIIGLVEAPTPQKAAQQLGRKLKRSLKNSKGLYKLDGPDNLSLEVRSNVASRKSLIDSLKAARLNVLARITS